jgi:hypothetical protein
MRAMGASPEELAQWAARAERNAKESGFPVLPENLDAVRLFCAASTQWRRAGMGGVPLGLEYPGLEAASRMMGVAMTPELFESVRVMEFAALEVLIERHNRK